jgi:hypothetical protein
MLHSKAALAAPERRGQHCLMMTLHRAAMCLRWGKMTNDAKPALRLSLQQLRTPDCRSSKFGKPAIRLLPLSSGTHPTVTWRNSRCESSRPCRIREPTPYLDDLFSMADQVHLDATFVRIPDDAMFEVLDVNRRSTLALTQLWCSLSHLAPINGTGGTVKMRAIRSIGGRHVRQLQISLFRVVLSLG